MTNNLETGEKLLVQKIAISFVFLTLFGMLIPNNWSEILGVVSIPIKIVADTVPAIRKSADISPIPDLVRGFLGFAYLAIPIIVILLFWKDPTRLRLHRTRERLFGARLLSIHKVKNFAFLYFFALPFCIFIIWFFWSLPVTLKPGLTPTRGQMLFHLAVNYRIFLAILGAFLGIGVSLICWTAIMFAIFPLITIKQRDQQ